MALVLPRVLFASMWTTQTKLSEPSCYSTTIKFGSGSTPRTRTRTSAQVRIVQTLLLYMQPMSQWLMHSKWNKTDPSNLQSSVAYDSFHSLFSYWHVFHNLICGSILCADIIEITNAKQWDFIYCSVIKCDSGHLLTPQMF